MIKTSKNEIVIIDEVEARIILKNREGLEVGQAIIDTDMIASVAPIKWRLNGNYTYGYIPGKGDISLHSFIMGGKKEGLVIDHINRDTLDNRRRNLRYCTVSENIFNSKLYSKNKTGTRGVSYYANNKRYIADLKVRGKRYYLGSYETLEEASKVRKEYERKIFGAELSY